jgi:hypothetical protein
VVRERGRYGDMRPVGKNTTRVMIEKIGMAQIQDVLGNRMQEGPIFKGCVNIIYPLGVWRHSNDSFSNFVSPKPFVLLQLGESGTFEWPMR